MIVLLNGGLVPDAEARVSVFDRSFLYGDGLFESIRVCHGRPFRWKQHLRRLHEGAAGLRLRLPFSPDDALESIGRLVEVNAMTEAMLRLTVSRGVGTRGYSARCATQPTWIMSLHPLPRPVSGWTLATARLRLHPGDALAGWKTANRLPQVLARTEAEEAGADEALLLNARDELCETSSGNLFWVEGDRLVTPPAHAGLLPGITRAVVLELAPTLGLQAVEETGPRERLVQSDGAFVTLTSLGVVEVTTLDGRALDTSPWTARLRSAYEQLLARECQPDAHP